MLQDCHTICERKIPYVCLCVNVNTLHTTPFSYIIFYYLWFCISFWKCIFAPEAMHKHSTIPCSPSPLPYTHSCSASTLPCAHAGRREIWMTHYSSCVSFLFPFFTHTHIFICHRSAWQSTMSAGEREKQSWNQRGWDRKKAEWKSFVSNCFPFARVYVCYSLFKLMHCKFNVIN